MEWKTVYVFVSSTFNDMHAERDLLVKRVFPELRLWCARRKLQLRDIDLRWGVSAADAQENKRVVEVCLRNIDRCRPFFLCFMGQRRGWVPQAEDINPETLTAFPELGSHIGSASVTEMEVLHALLHPLEPGAQPVRHARFYFRDGAYTKTLRTEEHKNLFIPSRSLFRSSDKGVDDFKKRLNRQHSTVTYTARWNPELPSPELTGALAKGRLEDFRTGDHTLESDVLEWLKKTIAQEYPEHQELPKASGELDLELDRQDTQRFQCSDGYIPRPAEEQALARSLEAAGTRPLVLLAQAGCGKTSMLASFLNKIQDRPVYYRFVGTTPQSFRLDTLSASLTEQWVRDGLLPENVLQYTPGERKLIFPNLCVQAAQAKPFLLVLDGMDQLLGSENWYDWLPRQLPQGAALLMSLRDTGAQLPEELLVHRLGLMTDPRDKAMMASAYLGNFLKDIDENQMDRLLSMEGSSNPLYMKIVLNELRQHGSFDTLMELFGRNYGSTPLSAFKQVLARVERELKDTFFDPAGAMALFFGCLAYAQQGLDGQIFLWACRNLKGWDGDKISDRQVLDLVYGLGRELEPFLVMDGDRFALRYDSLRQAICQDYSALLAQYANIMLAQAFLLRLGYTLEKEDALTTLMHTENATEDYIKIYYTHPARLVLLLRCAGAETLAKSCDALVIRRNLREYGDLAKVLRKAAARLDTNPKTLFMELDRHGDHNNPLTAQILQGGRKYDTGVILQPRYPADAASSLCWEYAHPDSSIGCEVWAAPYFIYRSTSEKMLKVVDIRTRETVHVMQVTPMDPMSKILLAGEKDILFLCQENSKRQVIQLSAYRLPDMMPLIQTVTRECPHGTIWQLHAHNGKLYALLFDRIDSSREGGKYTVCCLSTGEVLFHLESKNNVQYKLCGGWFVYRDDGAGICQVIALEDGRCLYEDRFLGTDYLDPDFARRLTNYAKLFANKANLHAASADKLYIWQSGSRVDPQEGIVLMQRRQRLAVCGDGLVLEESWDERVSHPGSFTVLEDQYLITESQGYVHILDSSWGLKGKMNLGESIMHTSQAETAFALFDGQLLMFHKNKIRSYDMQQLMAALDPEMEESFTGRRSSAIVGSDFYVMDLEMERTNLQTLETEKEKTNQKQYWERYDPWHMQGQDLWIGYGVRSGNFTVKRPDTMSILGKGSMPHEDTRELRNAFLYRDKDGVIHVGLLQSKKERTKRFIKNENQDFAKLYLMTKPLHKLYADDTWTQRDLMVEFAALGLNVNPTSFTVAGKPYLFLPNLYKNQWTLQLRVYDVLENTTYYSKDLDLHNDYYLFDDDIHIFPGGIMYEYGKQEDGRLDILDMTVDKVFNIKRWLGIVTKEAMATQVCLFDRNSRELLRYDTVERKLTKLLTLGEKDRVHQVILLEKYVLLTHQHEDGDIVKIYDRGNGELLCTQRLEVSLDEPKYHEDTGIIAMVDSNCRKYFWKVDVFGEK